MVQTANTIWRDYNTDGVPSSEEYDPKKPDIRAWGTWVEGIITAFTSNGGLIYSSKAAMDADLAHAANSMAWVIGDPVAANNGVYGKVGVSGSGSWTRLSDLPFSFIIASDAGAGTPNAIQATTSIPVSESALIWMNIFEANTAGPVTVSFNGGSALAIKTNSGNDVVAGGLTAGMIVMGIVSGSTFRLVSDQASAAIVAAAEAAAAAALAAANAGYVFGSESAFEAADIPVVLQFIETAGYYVTGDGGGHTKKRVATPDVIKPWHKQSADGAWWEISEKIYNPLMFGAKRDGETDDTAAIQAAFDFGAVVFIPEGTYIQTIALALPSDTIVYGAGMGKTILKFPDGANKIHHSIVSANATSLDARIATLANVDSLISGYIENSAIYDLTIDGNSYNRVKTYTDREQGTAIELHTVRNVIVQRVEAIRGPQHNFNVRAGTNSFMLGYSYVAPYPSQFVKFLDCRSDDQEIDDGITTHDSEYLWIERCKVFLSRAKNATGAASASNGIEVDDGSRYVWVTDCYVDGAFGGYQAKGHEATPPAHHVWFTRCIAENNHHGFIVSAVLSTTTDADAIFGTCHNIHIIDCTIKNLYNFTNGIGWEHSSNYVQLTGSRHVVIENLTVVGKTANMPNTDLTAGECYFRFRENNYHITIDGVHFTAVNDRAGTLALIQAQSTNQKITIRNVTVDQYTKAPVILTTDAGVDWTIDNIRLLSGSSSYPVVSFNGVGGGTLRARRISGASSQAPCSLGGVLCPGYDEKDVNTRAVAAENVYQRLVAGLDAANVAGMQGANLGMTFSYSVGGTVTRMGGIVVTPNNTSPVNGTSVTTRVGLQGRASGGSDMTPLYWAQEGSFYANLDNAYSCGSSGRRWSVVYAGTGTINTSDERQKQQIRDLSEAERAVAVRLKELIRAFKFNDAVEKKGDGARWHFGVIAQEVKAAFEAEGLTAEDYGPICLDEWEATPEIKDEGGNVLEPAVPAGSAYGVRYEELLAFVISAM